MYHHTLYRIIPAVCCATADVPALPLQPSTAERCVLSEGGGGGSFSEIKALWGPLAQSKKKNQLKLIIGSFSRVFLSTFLVFAVRVFAFKFYYYYYYYTITTTTLTYILVSSIIRRISSLFDTFFLCTSYLVSFMF